MTPAQAHSLALAVRHVNASTPDTITESGLRRFIRTGVVPDRHRHHVLAFIDETDLETLTDMEALRVLQMRGADALRAAIIPVGDYTALLPDALTIASETVSRAAAIQGA